MLLGGIIFGIMGDRWGRISVLFGSILLYSLANLANSFVHDVGTYALLRFIAGVGLAGELGAGITLVAETLPQGKRGLGTTIVAAVGVSGALLAWYVASTFHWRFAYLTGGLLGLMLLLLRVGVLESGLFKKMKESNIQRGNFLMIFQNRDRFRRFIGSIFVGAPLWYIVGILITLSPEFARALEVQGPVEGGKAIFYNYAGLVVGDFASGILSQLLASRKKCVGIFLFFVSLGVIAYFMERRLSVLHFYWLCFYLGCAAGYWAMFATISAEQFGTNLRATVATSVPNFVRGSLVLISALFMMLKPMIGILHSGLLVGIIVMGLAFFGLYLLNETYHIHLDFEET